jgi:hypothetical protein
MCQKVEFAGWVRFKPKVTPYSLRDVDTPDHRRLRATSRDKAELAEPGSVPGYIESFTASRRNVTATVCRRNFRRCVGDRRGFSRQMGPVLLDNKPGQREVD